MWKKIWGEEVMGLILANKIMRTLKASYKDVTWDPVQIECSVV